MYKRQVFFQLCLPLSGGKLPPLYARGFLQHSPQLRQLHKSQDVYKRQAWYCGLALLLAPTFANALWNKGGWIQNRANTLAPVSYTHLDVYKRQAEGMAKAGATIVFNDIRQELVDKGLAAYREAGVEAHGLSLIHI